jgi:hypothetical protein
VGRDGVRLSLYFTIVLFYVFLLFFFFNLLGGMGKRRGREGLD